MTATYEEVAHSYPRIRRDVLFTQTPAGVVFHNAHGGFNLRGRSAYRFASLIVPHLNGTRRVDEICAGFGDTQRAMVAELVGALYGRDFARDVKPGSDGHDELPPDVLRRFGPQIDYIDHYTGEAGGRFRRFRETRVAVLGRDAVARWCALSLVRNGAGALTLPAADGADDPFATAAEEAAELAADGCPVELTRLDGPAEPGWAELAGCDLVVVTGGPGRILGLLRAGLPEGVRLLPAWTCGRQAVAGPVMGADTTGCWGCAALRLGASGAPGDAADLWSGALLDEESELPLGGPPAAMLGNLLGYEVFRLTTGALAPETRERLVLQDLDSLDVAGEPLLPHPRCPFCHPAAEAPGTADLTPAHTPPAEDVTAPEQDADAALAGLDARTVLVQPRTGVFTGFTDDDWEQTPLKAGTVLLPVGHTGSRAVSAFDVHHVAGARLRALYRAAEVYTEHVVPQGGARTGAGGEQRLEPARFDIFSGVEAAPPRSWVPAVPLTGGAPVLVPLAALRTFGAANRDRAFVPTSAGSAASDTPGTAVERALYSAVAFRALDRALRGRGDVALLRADTGGDDRELVFLHRSAAHLGLTVDLLELDGARLAPVLLARAADPGTGRPLWAVAGAPTRRQAAVEALRDLLGQVQLSRDPAATGPADTGDPFLGDLEPGTLTATREAPPKPPAAVTSADVLDRLRTAGGQALAVSTGSADLRAGGIHVARVLLTRGAENER